VETDGFALDSSHLNETVRLLDEKLLCHPKWGLWRTGIPLSFAASLISSPFSRSGFL